MAIIAHGSLEDFSANVVPDVAALRAVLSGSDRFSVLRETTREVQPVPVEFRKSDNPRGLALHSIRLMKGFEGFIANLFRSTRNEVYFLAWTWDFSGNPPTQYPGPGATKESNIIPLKTGELREFIGAGIVLHPARPVSAGLAVRIQIWESDKGVRDFGKVLADVGSAVKDSELSALLSPILSGAGVTTTTIDAVKKAAAELAEIIGGILQANSNDYVDFYEGYYPVKDAWEGGNETHRGAASEIVLTRLV